MILADVVRRSFERFLQPKASQVVRLLLIAIAFGLTLFGKELPLVSSLDNTLMNWRFASAPRPASGNLVYLAIDKQTLDYVGTWPWPRSRYASLLDRLSSFGVNDIFIDVDFSTPSVVSEDVQLSRGLQDAGGGVILPVFKQHQSAGADGQTVVTQPIAAFAANAWLAFANVAVEQDGNVRRFELGDLLDGQLVQSVAGVLSKMQPALGSELIDYSIQPATVPTISLSQVMKPDFDGAALKDRTVVIGAFATELKDIFPVPVYHQLPGPMLHILAAETILQKRLLKEIKQLPVELGFAAAVIAAALALRTVNSAIPFLLALSMLAAGEAGAFVLQRDYGLVIYTASCWVILGLGLLLTLIEKVDFSRLLAELANAEQRNIRRLLRKVVTDSTDAVLAFDERLNVFEASESASSMLGGDGTSFRGKSLRQAIPPDLYELVLDLASRHDSDPDEVKSAATRFSLSVDGSVKHFDATITLSPTERLNELVREQLPSFIGSLMIRDVTARQIYEERLQYLSLHDDLTGLMNRRAFVGHFSDGKRQMYVAAIGLHRFSVLNATMGRDVGDELLRAVAARLQNDETIEAACRLGGDVFAVAVSTPADLEPACCAEGLIDLFEMPFELANSRIHLSVRIGICSFSGDGAVEAALERAEHALDAAKGTAGSGWRAYEAAAAARQHEARRMENAMQGSLQREEFFLLYQPQIDLHSGAMTGAEALLRWQHPELGLVSPASFIPVAEANGFICELGRWALAEACRAAASWPDHLGVAVNVAPIQIVRTDLVADVKRVLADTGLAPSRLTLEITESAFVDQVSMAIAIMEELRSLGLKIALDDFGTGYSSLSYMTRFPLDKLKIDQSFVKRMASDKQSLAIVETVKTLAGSLRLDVVAEGIESETEWTLLKEMGCEYGQGYLFGRPQASQQLLSLLDRAPWIAAA